MLKNKGFRYSGQRNIRQGKISSFGAAFIEKQSSFVK